MGYYNGVAVDMAAVRAALIDACELEGWDWDGTNQVLSKDAMFLQVQVVSSHLTLLGRTSATSGSAPYVVRIGPFGSHTLAWPMTYEIFAFESEVFMVINYSVDFFQWCAFGASNVAALPGSGMWIGASLGAENPSSGVGMTATTGGTGGLPRFAPALLWRTADTSGAGGPRSCLNYWIHSGLDGQGWWLAQSQDGAAVGVGGAVPLMGLLPNTWNSEGVLLPIRGWKVRPSSKVSLTVEVENARWTRVDNYEPGQIIYLGAERWKVFPWLRKNTAEPSSIGGAIHTGTFGWAIRYEGP